MTKNKTPSPPRVVTRFAPAPTGSLHIGSARTALFNWLYARNQGGIFRLRIEDTDRERSTPAATQAILEGLRWLGLEWEGDVYYQHTHLQRHQEVAQHLLDTGQAYFCQCTPQELEAMREKARAEGKPPVYDRRCRERLSSASTPADVLGKAAVRLKAPLEGVTQVHDLVQGTITVDNRQLDDLILLRTDGTPTYMISVVVDDHDMGVTHIIRGDDHLTNTFRQYQIYQALGWDFPLCAHIPLIHGSDGAKLSKRHGALGVAAYQKMGFLPEALCNYLLRLGWSHGDDEIIDRAQAITWFNLEGIGKSPSRFDLVKLTNLNGHYLRHTPDGVLLEYMEHLTGSGLSVRMRQRVSCGMAGLKERAKTLVELAENAKIYTQVRPIFLDEKARTLLSFEARSLLEPVFHMLKHLTSAEWTAEKLESCLREYSVQKELAFGKIAQPLRAALTGAGVSPGIFDVMVVLGQEESLGRLMDVLF